MPSSTPRNLPESSSPTQRQEPRQARGAVVASVDKLEDRQRRALEAATTATAAWFDAAVDSYPGGATALAEESGASEGDISKMRSGERPVQFRLCWFLLTADRSALALLFRQSERADFAPPKRRRKVSRRQLAEALLALAREKGLFDLLRQETANRLGVTVTDLDVALDPTSEEQPRRIEDDDA